MLGLGPSLDNSLFALLQAITQRLYLVRNALAAIFKVQGFEHLVSGCYRTLFLDLFAYCIIHLEHLIKAVAIEFAGRAWADAPRIEPFMQSTLTLSL